MLGKAQIIPNISQKAFLVRGCPSEVKSAPCVKVNESLSTLSLSELSRVQMKSCHFLSIPQPLPTVSFAVTAASLKPLREMPCEKYVFTIFSHRTKIFRLLREWPPWNTQHPMERFCLNLVLQASWETCQEN